LNEALRTGVDQSGIIRTCDAKYAADNPGNQASSAKEFTGITIPTLQRMIPTLGLPGSPQFYNINKNWLDKVSPAQQTQTTAEVGTWIAEQILPPCKNSCTLAIFQRQGDTGNSHYFNIARIGNSAKHSKTIWAIDAYSAPQPSGITLKFPVKVGAATLKAYLTALGGPGFPISNIAFILIPSQARAINDLAKIGDNIVYFRHLYSSPAGPGADLLIPSSTVGGKKPHKTKRKTKKTKRKTRQNRKKQTKSRN